MALDVALTQILHRHDIKRKLQAAHKCGGAEHNALFSTKQPGMELHSNDNCTAGGLQMDLCAFKSRWQVAACIEPLLWQRVVARFLSHGAGAPCPLPRAMMPGAA